MKPTPDMAPMWLVRRLTDAYTLVLADMADCECAVHSAARARLTVLFEHACLGAQEHVRTFYEAVRPFGPVITDLNIVLFDLCCAITPPGWWEDGN